MASATTNGVTVELLSDATGHNGRLKFTGNGGTSTFDTVADEADIVFTSTSLACVSGPVSACLVSGRYTSRPGAQGEAFVWRAGSWSLAGGMYSSAGTFTLVTGSNGGDPQVITVQDYCGVGVTSVQCENPVLYVQLFSVNGMSIGCTLTATDVSLLPGKGTSAPPSFDLNSCPKSAG